MPKMLHTKGDGGVFLATPAYSGLSASYTHALFNSVKALTKAGINCELAIYAENCHVDDGRNILVRDFLESKCDMLVFLDADLRWHNDDLIKLIGYDKDVVAGIYPLKQEIEGYPVNFFPGEIWTDKDGLIEVMSVPTGFLKISRHVLESLASRVPSFKGKSDHFNQREIPVIFERTLDNNNRRGGDYEFCKKWREIGGKIYVDPSIKFSHEGMGEWSGSLANYLRKENGLTNDFIKEILDKISKGTETPEDLFSLCDAWGNNHWSVHPDFLSAMIMIAREVDGPIIECGLGITTLVLGALGKKVVSLEHQSFWADKMKDNIEKMNFNNISVECRPLKDCGDYRWYDFESSEKFSMIVVDGPPRDVSNRGGFIDYVNLSTDCIVMADDAWNMSPWERMLNTKFSIFGDKKKFAIAKLNSEELKEAS